MPPDMKRSITIHGHRTSLSLEPEFWSALQRAAKRDGKSVAALITMIDDQRGDRNLSSAIRVYLLQQ
jgi:predicted DNA-binding ribbon-helix-helix protein